MRTGRDESEASSALCAATAGVGGGNFSSSMANISFFYPERKKGFALGLNAAGGNLGVAVTQEVSQSSHLAWQHRGPLEDIVSPVQDGLSRQLRLADLRGKKSDHHTLCRRSG